jgi:endonuclease-3
MTRTSNPEVVLDAIRDQVEDLDPPVNRFETGIRRGPFRILISVLLSSRTQDPVTLKASRALFEAADTPEKMLKLGEERIRTLIYPVGFFRQKAAHIMRICHILAEQGGVPDTFEELTGLPGVGRKTANLVLALAFDRPAVAVDTHVFRISRRLGWAREETPERVEEELRRLFPDRLWNRLNKTLVGFGQTLCKPQNPNCRECRVSRYCPFGLSKR